MSVIQPTYDEILKFCEESNRIERAPDNGPVLEAHALAALQVVAAAEASQVLHPKVLHVALFAQTEGLAGVGNPAPVGRYSHLIRAIVTARGVKEYLPPPDVVAQLMPYWWGELAAGRLDPWTAHHAFECIHPFSDGNGRVGRLVLCNLLLLEGLPWEIIRSAEVDNYYSAIQQWRREHFPAFCEAAGVLPRAK